MTEYFTLANALSFAMLLAGGFGWRWLDRIQEQQDKQTEAVGKLKEKVLEEYAKRADVASGDQQILEHIKALQLQVQRIDDKLDGKKDKTDGRD